MIIRSRLGSNTLIAIALLIAMQAFGAAAAFAESTTAPGASPTAVFAGGCFWGVEGVFEHVRGVREVQSGYAGGDAGTAHYDAVSGGRTGHAEAVQITFDPQEISYGELLQIFFSVAHDPTQLNRQGPDTDRSIDRLFFYADDTQRDIAARVIAELNESSTFRDAIVTRVDPLQSFYPAESYHQDFIAKNPRHPYVVFHDLPKIRNLKKRFPDFYREGL